MTVTEFRPGDRVRIEGEHGTYKVLSPALAPDGSVRIFGGDKDPNGHQAHRSIMPDRLRPENRRNMRKEQ